VIKSRRMRWARDVARVGRGKMQAEIFWENLREEDHVENRGLDGG
jgi:hypothetical protein